LFTSFLQAVREGRVVLQGLWTVGIKVPDLEQELAFHRAIGNEIVLDETLHIAGIDYRIPLVRMGDKYIHLASKMVYEDTLGIELPYGPTHLVYVSNDFEADVSKMLDAGAQSIQDPIEVSAGFGDRKVGFFRAPGGWIFEVAKIYQHRVPEVI